MRRPKPTYSNVTATLALFVALGGTSWAVTQLPRNSVGASQLRANSVSGAKVRDGSLSASDLAAGALARGPRGSEGPTGPVGSPGPVGARGPSDGYVHQGPEAKAMATQANLRTTFAKLDNLPAGSYVIAAYWHLGDFNNGGSISGCNIVVNGEYLSGSDSVVGNGAASTRVAGGSTSGGVTRSSPFQVTLECRTDQSLGAPPTVYNPRLTAVRVENLRVTSG